MTQISKRLNVEGPDHENEFELVLDCNCDEGNHYHYITRAEADALIDALSVRDASGRLIAPPQAALAVREPGPHDSNLDAREPVKE